MTDADVAMATARRGDRRAGFSLIEAIVSLALLVVGMVPLAGALVTTNHGREDAERIYRMHVLAANQMEAVKLQSGSVTELVNAFAGDGTFVIPSTELAGLAGDAAGRVEVTRLSPGGTSALVQVHVDYIDATGKPRRESVSTVVRKMRP